MKITIEIGTDELVDAIARLAGALAPAKQPPAGPLWGPFSDGVTIAQLDPAGELEFVQKVDPPIARNGFTYTPASETSTTLAPAPAAASSTLAPEPPTPAPKPTAQQRLAASKVGADLKAKRQANGAGLDFEAFDALVRKEVKRLSTAGAMPSHAFWDEFRDPALPTLVNVIARYGVSGAGELAKLLGYAPSLRGPRPQPAVDEETQEAEAVSA